MECLTRLCELKANNTQDGSLLQFALRELFTHDVGSESWEELEQLGKSLQLAARLSSTELAAEVGRFNNGLRSLSEEIGFVTKAARSGDEKADRFVEIMTPFASGAQNQMQELLSATDEMNHQITQMKAYFAEEAKVVHLPMNLRSSAHVFLTSY